MSKKMPGAALAAALVAVALSAAVLSSVANGDTPANQVHGGCSIQADATLSPGLTLKSHSFDFAYKGTLSHCFYTGSHAAHGRSIGAGQEVLINGHRFQEPTPTGSGTCLSTDTKGYDFSFWRNGTQTIVKYVGTSASGGTQLTGEVVPQLRLKAVDPKPGAPKSFLFHTTNFNGQKVAGTLNFSLANAADCSTTAGLTGTTITGKLSHHGAQAKRPAQDLSCKTAKGTETCKTIKPAKGTQSKKTKPPLKLTSSAFANGGTLPNAYTCNGSSEAPALSWANVPAKTRQLELLFRDTTLDDLSQWVVYAIPSGDRKSPVSGFPKGATVGTNGLNEVDYAAPCPLVGAKTHKYTFELFASKKALSLPAKATTANVLAALKGKTLASATLTAKVSR